jgi:opacity protein-like surface antigen
MNRLKLLGLVIVTMLALSAAVASSASAVEVPEFEKNAGEVEGSGGTATFNGEGGNRYSYQTTELEGKTKSKTELGGVTLKFLQGGEQEGCINIGKNGLEFAGVNAKLGWINKAKDQVGLMFEDPTQPLASCKNYTHLGAGETRYFLGEFIGEITPVGVTTSKYTITFKTADADESWEQLPVYFEGEKHEKGGPELEVPLKLGECSTCRTKTNWRTGIVGSLEIEFNTTTKIV